MTTASVAGKAQVVALAKSLEVSIYSVGIQGFDMPRGFLKSLAEDTGGAYHFPNKTSELIKVFEAISKDLKNSYLVAYSPKRAADNTYRKIEVKVSGPTSRCACGPGTWPRRSEETGNSRVARPARRPPGPFHPPIPGSQATRMCASQCLPHPNCS